MLVELEMNEGEGLPVELMQHSDVEVVVVKRINTGATVECVRVSTETSVESYVNPNTFMTEQRLCHIWRVTHTYKGGSNIQDIAVPVNDIVYDPDNVTS